MSSAVATPMVLGLGAPEIVIIILVVMLLFGAKKLPELARGTGQALRIFKSETRGLTEDEQSGRSTDPGSGQSGETPGLNRPGGTGDDGSAGGTPTSDPNQAPRRTDDG